jgi:hypothetical protein
VMTDSVIVSVSVTWTVVKGVTVRSSLTIGVMIVVLRAVCVTVIEVVVGVCRQEHANSMSVDGRERTLANMLAASVDDACLLRMVTATVVLTVSVSVSVLSFKISMRPVPTSGIVFLHCDNICDYELSGDVESRCCGGRNCFYDGLERYSHSIGHRGRRF